MVEAGGDRVLVRQAYRYELDPNVAQRTLLAKHAGTARFAFNFGLALCRERLEKGEKVPRAAELHRLWNAFKREGAPWWVEVSKCSPQEALRDLDRAFRNFWRGRSESRPVGFPRFRRKGVHDAFRLTGSIHVEPRHVVLPRLGKIRTKERTDKFQGRILSASVVWEACRWYVSLTVERERPDPTPVVGPSVGIDLGLTSFAVLSDGTTLQSPRALERSLTQLRRLSKAHSRKGKGSQNRRKSALRLARVHRRIRNQRRDFLHKATTELAKAKSVIVVEDLNVRGMLRNRHLARHIAGAGWSEFRRMLVYKTAWYGGRLVVAPRFFASSKTCSACGAKKDDLDLSQRVYRCEVCGNVMDRDLNAARNLVALAL